MRSLAITTLTAAIASCGEYPHTNPLEPSANVSITILGPSIVAQRTTYSYTFESNPKIPGVSPDWSSQQPDILQLLIFLPDGSGVFRAVKSGTAQISVALGPHVQTKTVVVQLP